MFQLLTSVVQFVLNTALEIFVYVLVDTLTKNTMRDVSEVSEKRTIWLCEVAVLSFLGVGLLVLHHVPYLLAALTCLTLAYTQLLERVDFRYWWVNLWTKWEEFQQHEESMGRLNEMKHQQMRQSYVTPNGRWTLTTPQPQPPQHPSTQYIAYDASMAPAEAWYPADSAGKCPGLVAFSEPPATCNYTLTQPRQRTVMHGPAQGFSQMPEYIVHQAPSTPTYSFVPVSRVRDLARPPIHPAAASAPKSPPQPPSIKSRFMSVLGMKTPSNVPAGLRNNGENICFMNSVLQCLAHVPGLPMGLSQAQKPDSATPAQAALTTAVMELLQGLAKAPTEQATMHCDRVRHGASSLPGTMVTHPKQPQQQQDAAEFLMWILDALHSALNMAGKSTSKEKTQGGSSMPWITPRYSSGALNMLRFIYGDLTPEKITELKAACRKEIEMAGGIDVGGYAEAVQRLSDLEWLTYKETTQSIVDDLFTGQIVEALHCTACSRLTVDIQSFNILPVPICRPRSLNGLVRLEDCLATFGTVEELLGPDGLQCECCNRKETIVGEHDSADQATAGSACLPPPGIGASPILSVNGVTRIRIRDTVRRRKLGSDSAIYSPIVGKAGNVLSPIAGNTARGGDAVHNDSGFQEHVPAAFALRTSTPVGRTSTGAPVRLTDGQRRALLRQVPECLIIQLMRFTYAGGQPVKLHQSVTLPLTGLDLTPHIVDTVIRRPDSTGAQSAPQRYDLCGLCLHLGSDVTASGHYVSYGRTTQGEWYRYDDEHVVPVNMDYELSTRQVRENAYLAFYRKSNHS